MAPPKTTARSERVREDILSRTKSKDLLRIWEKITAGVVLTSVEQHIWSEFKAPWRFLEPEIKWRRIKKEIKEKRKAEKRARWEARCPMLVKTLSALKRLVLMRKKPAAKKPVVTTKPPWDYLGRTTPQSSATGDRPWAPRTQPTSISAYKSSPRVAPRVSPGRLSS
jgi:hypothetical protein